MYLSNKDMKTMKFWRNILVMIAAMLSLASCDSNDKKEGDWDSLFSASRG
jgi:hypothetical protein